MNHARFLLCFAAATTMAFVTMASAQIPVSAPEGTHIRISQYDPKNPEHALIVETVKVLCMGQYRERIAAAAPAAKSAENQRAGLEILMTAFGDAVDEAGICAHRLNYDFSVYEMRKITGVESNFAKIASSAKYQTARKESAYADAARCGQVRYRALAETTDATTEIILHSRLFCMSLLGKQSGVAAAMSYFRVTLD